MENKNITYIAGGLVVGVLLTLVISMAVEGRQEGRHGKNGDMMHKMSDGTKMENSKMSMDSMMDDMMMNLDGKIGDAFDKAFLSEMIIHHQGAVVMADAALKASKRPEIIKLSKEIISAQNKEVQMMKAWQIAWFK